MARGRVVEEFEEGGCSDCEVEFDGQSQAARHTNEIGHHTWETIRRTTIWRKEP